MQSLFILVPIALVFVIAAIACFFWSVKSGQFEDLEREASRILFTEDDSNTESTTKQKSNSTQND